METRLNRCLLVLSVASAFCLVPQVVRADDTITGSSSGSSMSTSSSTSTVSSPQVITVQKPVVLHETQKIVEKQVLTEKTSSGKCRHRSARPRRRIISHAPAVRSTSRTASSNKSTFTSIEKTVEKPIVIEKPVVIDRPVETPVYIDHTVEKPVFIERQVEKPVIMENKAVESPVVIQKKGSHHLLNVKLF